MAYLDATNLHSLPVTFEQRESEPSYILFPHGPQWTRRYQKTQMLDRLDNQFMYKDQGPPMYQLLGAHYNMYKTPQKTDYHYPARSYYYEPRQYNSPNFRNGAITFPPGPPPPQVAMYDGLVSQRTSMDPKLAGLEVPGRTVKDVRTWDKYRYLPGPPSGTQILRTANQRDQTATVASCWSH